MDFLELLFFNKQLHAVCARTTDSVREGGSGSLASSVSSVTTFTTTAMENDEIQKQPIVVADIPAIAAGIGIPPGGESKLCERDQQLQVAETVLDMSKEQPIDRFSIEKFSMKDVEVADGPTVPFDRINKKHTGPPDPEKMSRLLSIGSIAPLNIKADQLRQFCTREGIRKPDGKQCTARKKTMVHAIIWAKLNPSLPKKIEITRRNAVNRKRFINTCSLGGRRTYRYGLLLY